MSRGNSLYKDLEATRSVEWTLSWELGVGGGQVGLGLKCQGKGMGPYPGCCWESP